MYDLTTLGFSPFFEQQLTLKNTLVARIAAEHRGGYQVLSPVGEGLAKLSGKLTQDIDNCEFPSVGDWVILGSPPSADHPALIEAVLTRRTVFVRGTAGRKSDGQVVAANIDVVFIICGLDNDFNLRRVERYLARVYASGAEPVVVLNKTDLCDDAEYRVAQTKSSCIGVEVVTTNAVREQGLEPILSHLSHSTTAAFVGSSGAGKSTIINALVGNQTMETGEIRARDGRGCHTTTHRQLVVLPQGGLLIDTPGMRELQLIDEEGIDAVFSDIEEISSSCRFRDCGHLGEPGCAVKKAVDTGEISALRLEHYHKMQREAEAYELRHNEHKRRKSEKVWGQLHNEAERIRRWKEGK